jgi:diguanylate cyclase (GGDEF)-like protein
VVALQAPIGQALRAIAHLFWRTPEPCLREAGWRSEAAVAQVRLALLAVLCVVPMAQLVTSPASVETWFGLILTLVALTLGVVLHVAARHGSSRSQLGLISSLLDVTLVSCGLAFFMLIDRPLTATNSFIIFPFYFLAIASTSLRFDPRLCLLAGIAAIVEYTGIVGWAVARGVADSSLMAEQIARHGSFDVYGQLGRLLLLGAAAFIAAASVVRSRELLSRSLRDPLTGLLNRAAFFELARVELARTRRQGVGLVMALLDLDFFKRVNDMHGHKVGDIALEWFGGLLLERFRESDAVGRLGGDEFAILLCGPTRGRAGARLEELRHELESASVPGTPGVRLSVSGGVALCPDDGDSVEALIELADDRLYQAKGSGRNRIVLASGPTTAVIRVDHQTVRAD